MALIAIDMKFVCRGSCLTNHGVAKQHTIYLIILITFIVSFFTLLKFAG